MKSIFPLFLFFAVGLSAQMPTISILEPYPHEIEQMQYSNEGLLQKSANTGNYRKIAQNFELYNMGWTEFDSVSIGYLRDLHINHYTYWVWNTGTSSWNYSADVSYTYNAQNKIIEIVSKTWNGSAWVNDERSVLSYNGNGQTTDIFNYTWSGVWDNVSHYVYAYDGNGNISSEMIDHWVAGAWEHYQNKNCLYNGNNMMIEELKQMWSGSSWTNNAIILWTYSASNKITEVLHKSWNGASWVNSERFANTWDLNDLKTEYLYQMYSGGNWVNVSRNLFQYNGNLMSLDDYQTWDAVGLVWDNNKRRSIQYNVNNLLESVTVYLMGMGWYFDERFLYFYDSNLNHIEYLAQDYAMSWEDRSRTYHYYENYTPSAMQTSSSLSALSLFPNPTHEYCQLAFESTKVQDLRLSIYNNLGQLVQNEVQQVTSGKNILSIDLKNLAAGIYYLRIQHASGQETLNLEVR